MRAVGEGGVSSAINGTLTNKTRIYCERFFTYGKDRGGGFVYKQHLKLFIRDS